MPLFSFLSSLGTASAEAIRTAALFLVRGIDAVRLQRVFLLVAVGWMLSPIWAVEAPRLVAGTKSVMPHPNLSWAPVAAASRYTIEISSDDSFRTVVVRDDVDTPRFVPRNPLEAGDYAWRVRAIGTDGVAGAWSATGRQEVHGLTRRFLIPDTATLEQMRQILAQAAAQAPALVQLTPGAVYRVKPTDQVFLLEKARDLIIDGKGATIVIEEPSAGLLRLNACERIVVRNLTIDYDPLPHSVGRVEAITTIDRQVWLTLQPEPGYPRFDAPHMLQHWAWGVLLDSDPARRGWMKPNAGLVVNFDGPRVAPDAGSENLFRVPLTNASTAAMVAVGDRAIVFARNNSHSLLQANHCVDVSYVNLVAFACPGLHIAYIYGNELKVLGCEWRLKDSSRWFAGNADGVHVRANLLGPWIEGCRMQGIGDDGIALYNKGISVVAQLAPDRVRVLDTYMDVRPGDRFRIFNPREGYLGETEFTVRSAEQEGKNWIVAFTPALPAGVGLHIDLAKPDQCDQLFNRSRRNGGFVIRNNRFEGIRRFGTVFRSTDGVVRGNEYRGTSNAGIAAVNEPMSWQNGLESERVTIVGNTFESCVFDSAAANVGTINIAIRKLGGVSDRPLHREFRIIDNVISDWNQRAISLQNATASEIRRNTIRSTRTDFLVPKPGNRAIFVAHSADSEIAENDLSGEKRSLTEAITVETSTGLVVRDNRGTAP